MQWAGPVESKSAAIQPARRDVVRASLGRNVAGRRYLAVLVLLVAVFVYFSATANGFLTADNIKSLLTSVSVLWAAAIGMTFVILSGGFDLSIGAMVALAGVVFSSLYVDSGLPVAVAVLLTLVVGCVLGGAINGFLIGKGRLSFLVVTLGTLALYQGVLNLWSGGKTTAIFSTFLDELAFGEFAGIPYSVWLMASTFLIAFYVLHSTYFGRDVYAVGGNPVAARLAGVRVARTLIIVYAIAGGMAALGGIIEVGRIGAASPLVGDAIIFEASAAVLLGGTRFSGGVGGVTGTAFGVLFLGTLQNGLSVSGVDPFWQQVITGAILIAVISLEKVQTGEWLTLKSLKKEVGMR